MPNSSKEVTLSDGKVTSPRHYRRKRNWVWCACGADQHLRRWSNTEPWRRFFSATLRIVGNRRGTLSMPGGVGGGARKSSSYPICEFIVAKIQYYADRLNPPTYSATARIFPGIVKRWGGIIVVKDSVTECQPNGQPQVVRLMHRLFGPRGRPPESCRTILIG